MKIFSISLCLYLYTAVFTFPISPAYFLLLFLGFNQSACGRDYNFNIYFPHMKRKRSINENNNYKSRKFYVTTRSLSISFRFRLCWHVRLPFSLLCRKIRTKVFLDDMYLFRCTFALPYFIHADTTNGIKAATPYAFTSNYGK